MIASYDERAAGCVAFRKFDDAFCEMKRMFVSPDFHGLGIGRALAQRGVAEASSAGYRGMRLDTSRNQHAAMGLYESIGFKRIPAYYAIPEDFEDWLVFFELKFERSR